MESKNLIDHLTEDDRKILQLVGKHERIADNQLSELVRQSSSQIREQARDLSDKGLIKICAIQMAGGSYELYTLSCRANSWLERQRNGERY